MRARKSGLLAVPLSYLIHVYSPLTNTLYFIHLSVVTYTGLYAHTPTSCHTNMDRTLEISIQCKLVL